MLDSQTVICVSGNSGNKYFQLSDLLLIILLHGVAVNPVGCRMTAALLNRLGEVLGGDAQLVGVEIHLALRFGICREHVHEPSEEQGCAVVCLMYVVNGVAVYLPKVEQENLKLLTEDFPLKQVGLCGSAFQLYKVVFNHGIASLVKMKHWILLDEHKRLRCPHLLRVVFQEEVLVYQQKVGIEIR